MSSLCTGRYCTICEPEEFQILKELASLQRGASFKEQQKIMEKAGEFAEQRLKELQEKIKKLREKLRQREEELFPQALEKSLEGESPEDIAEMIAGDEQRQKLKEEIASLELEPKETSYEDTKSLLKDYEKKGYVNIQKGKIKLTSKGAQLLGRGFLRKITQNLQRRGMGTHRTEEIGHGPTLSRFVRRYELGDTYERIDIQKTLLNPLEKGKKMSEFGIEDIEVFEPQHETKLNVGIIIDESGSMDMFSALFIRTYRKKIDAAIETALALSELMRTNYPQDKLRIFKFSEEVKEIQPWEVIDTQVPMRCTDIRAGLRNYRITSSQEEGDKQVYLITDAEPNFENGKYVGFHQAARGLLEEASRCKQENITLNLVMLDQNSQLREFASMIAQQNVGRVVFTTSENLSEAILEDYITSKREKLLT
jgi:uncharacterized protein with von Willebrand factor type A (vWA) domain